MKANNYIIPILVTIFFVVTPAFADIGVSLETRIEFQREKGYPWIDATETEQINFLKEYKAQKQQERVEQYKIDRQKAREIRSEELEKRKIKKAELLKKREKQKEEYEKRKAKAQERYEQKKKLREAMKSMKELKKKQKQRR